MFCISTNVELLAKIKNRMHEDLGFVLQDPRYRARTSELAQINMIMNYNK